MSKRRQYLKDSIDKAVNYVVIEGGAVRAAAKLFGVPRSTIQFKIKNPETKFKSGPSPVLTKSEEQALCDFIVNLAKRGFPQKKEDIQTCVQDFLKANPRQNPFKNDRPGDAWFNAFLKRHPSISIRTSEGVTNASACVSESDIKKWFDEIYQYIIEQNITDVIQDPRRIFNADETGFNICPKNGKVLAERGSKNVYEIEKAGVKENITVMFSFSAAGFTSNPMIIYPYKRVPDSIVKSVPNTWGIGRSDTGWMTAAVFYEYIANVFYPQLIANNIPLPVILFVDGHKTHLTIEVSELCKELNIHLIALYPNATRILQPADVAAFRPIKAAWRKGLRDWYAANNYAKSLTKIDFAPLLKTILENVIKESTLINGFRVSGLYPFDKNNVDYSKCLATNNNSTVHGHEISVDTLNTNRIFQSIDQIPYVMTETDFREIVGEPLLSKCQTITEISLSESDQSFQALYKIWQKFNQIHSNITNAMTTNFNIDTELSIAQDQLDLTELSIAQDQLDLTSEIPTNTSLQPEYFLDEINGELLCFSQDQDETQDLSKAPNLIPTSPEPRPIQEKINSTEKITVLSNESLSQYLQRKVWPETPKRKGIKNTERLPFALTSNSYLDLLNAKKQKKEEEETAKENRKRIREEKKLEKENTKISTKRQRKENTNRKKAEKTIISKEITTPPPETITQSSVITKSFRNCHLCCKSILKRVLECGECLKTYHASCIPSSNKIHIPGDDEDGFLCHSCYRESNSDSSAGDLYELVKDVARRRR